MSQSTPFTIRNLLVRALSVHDFGLLKPHLEPVALSRGEVLIAPNEPIEHIYFLEDGIASVVANTDDGRCIEVGIHGREGMSGTAVLLGTDRTPHETFIQVPGSALRTKSDDLRWAIRQSPALHQLLLRYAQSFQVQVAHTALSNGSYRIEERLARWLLMCHDRLDGDDLPLTHEVVSKMLGVRRSGVTLAIQILEGAKIIRARRGLVTVLNRIGLQEIAGNSYGPPEAEYTRLMARSGNGQDGVDEDGEQMRSHSQVPPDLHSPASDGVRHFTQRFSSDVGQGHGMMPNGTA
jgi:CRP-like cAMP-binding protein